jgi:hypothetical protein
MIYCPRCGKEPIPEDLKFCSRCGLALAGVRGLVAEGESSAPADVGGEQKQPRQRGVRRGVKSLLTGLVLGVVGYLFITAKLILDGRIPPHDVTRELLLPLGYIGVACLLFLGPVLFLFGVARIIHALGFEKGRLLEDARRSQGSEANKKQTGRASAADRAALPPSQSIPVTAWTGAVDTSELAAPPSVTERTTKLIRDEGNRHE